MNHRSFVTLCIGVFLKKEQRYKVKIYRDWDRQVQAPEEQYL
jgi:hypothetical protein